MRGVIVRQTRSVNGAADLLLRDALDPTGGVRECRAGSLDVVHIVDGKLRLPLFLTERSHVKTSPRRQSPEAPATCVPGVLGGIEELADILVALLAVEGHAMIKEDRHSSDEIPVPGVGIASAYPQTEDELIGNGQVEVGNRQLLAAVVLS